MDDLIRVREINLQPRVIGVLTTRRALGLYVRRDQMLAIVPWIPPTIAECAPERHRDSIPAKCPDDVVELSIASPQEPAKFATALDAVGDNLVVPTLLRMAVLASVSTWVVVPEIRWDQEDEDPAFFRRVDDPVGVGKVRFVGCAEVAGHENGDRHPYCGADPARNMLQRSTITALKPFARQSSRYFVTPSLVAAAISDQAASPWIRTGRPVLVDQVTVGRANDDGILRANGASCGIQRPVSP